MTNNYTPLLPDLMTPAPLPTTSGAVQFETAPLQSKTLYRSTPSLGGLMESGQVGPAALLGFAKAQETPAMQPTSEGGKVSFDEWLEGTGLTNAWGTGGAAIQKDIWAAYQGYLTGEAPIEEGAAGAAAPLFSPQEERLMVDLENAVKVGQLTEEQAWKIVENYWTEEGARQGRAQEATTRGTNLLAGALPTSTLPMTGPGGLGDILSKRYGIPDITPAFQGLPMEQALGVYGQTQQQMGLPAQLPSIQAPNLQLPNWGAFMQNMPTFGGGNKYIDQLLQQGRSTTGAPTLG